ncbi:hypothetical protein JW916_16715 [Candidatus Sumerlaeota bacterium]|nr:hypothetical protein [Candidatus Sumerlaeota bacterium]
MSGQTIDSASVSGSGGRRIVGLAVLLIVVFLLFRTVLTGDFKQLFGSAQTGLSRQTIRFNTGADLLSLLLLAATAAGLVFTRIGSIALNTFREAVRNRVLYFILFFAIILMGASVVTRQLVYREEERFIVHLGLSCISFFGLMVAVFVGISLVYNELERKTIYTIVSKPIHRYQFLLGKYFGLLLTVYVIVAVMTFFFFFVMNYQSRITEEKIDELIYKVEADGLYTLQENAGWIRTSYLLKSAGASALRAAQSLAGFAHGPVTQNIMIVVVMYCLELMIVTALAILYSSFSTPTLSAVFTVLTFLAGRLNEDMMRLAENLMKKSMELQSATSFADLTLSAQIKIRLAEFVSLVVPNLDSLNVTSKALYQDTMQVWRYPVLYSICYTGCVLLISILIFRKRNFK